MMSGAVWAYSGFRPVFLVGFGASLNPNYKGLPGIQLNKRPRAESRRREASAESTAGGGYVGREGSHYEPPLLAMAKPALSSSSSPSGASLSKDDLYAPLSKSDESTHSLSLRTSLRESALITFLSSTSESLKSSNECEFDLYQRIGGSIAQHGAGAGERSNGANRSVLEAKLQNRTLILVGGGIETTGIVNNKNESGCLKSGTAHIDFKCSRKRKRAGRGGIFGSVSNKKRKKIMRLANVFDDDTGRKRVKNTTKAKSCGANIGPDVANDKSSGGRAPGRVQSQSEGSCAVHKHDPKETTEVINNINLMWTEYFRQLTTSLDAGDGVESDSKALHKNRHLSKMLATSEKIGMAVTIIECPSRLNLVGKRGVVVNESAEMWKLAFINKTSKAGNRPASSPWDFMRVPKRGTVFRVDIIVSPKGDVNSMILQY